MMTEEHEYLFRKDAEAAAQDQRDNMGRNVEVEYTGTGFIVREIESAPEEYCFNCGGYLGDPDLLKCRAHSYMDPRTSTRELQASPLE